MTLKSGLDLNIRGESVQQVFDWYFEGRLVVNRRYQRKLIWSKNEKNSLIDTILSNYPIPLILIATYKDGEESKFEIIDGMQRLDAVFSFIENRYDHDGKYYDTSMMPTANLLRSRGDMEQRLPLMDDESCRRIANYKIPISEYKIDDPDEIDEIFRRINSNGRQLSKQELRQAGVLGNFANTVRDIATSIRGDVSHSNILPLSKMPSISISNGDLNYGIESSSIFWVKNGILKRDAIRDSKDESLIADLLGYLLMPDDEKPYSSESMIDKFYGRPKDSSEEAMEEAEAMKLRLDTLVGAQGADTVRENFIRVYDEIEGLCRIADKTYKELVGISENNPIPRYYSLAFLAFYSLMIDRNKKIKDVGGVIKALRWVGSSVDVITGQNWPAYRKANGANALVGVLSPFFEDDQENPASKSGVTEFENIVLKSRTEASSYDFKQGLHRLDDKGSKDTNLLEKLVQTICAIANEGKGNVGYIILGVCDQEADAKRVFELHKQESIRLGSFYISGVNHEIRSSYKNHDAYIHSLSDYFNSSSLSNDVKREVASSIRMLDYKGRDVVIIRIPSPSTLCFVGDKTFMRDANRTIEAKVTDIPMLIRRFSP